MIMRCAVCFGVWILLCILASGDDRKFLASALDAFPASQRIQAAAYDSAANAIFYAKDESSEISKVSLERGGNGAFRISRTHYVDQLALSPDSQFLLVISKAANERQMPTRRRVMAEVFATSDCRSVGEMELGQEVVRWSAVDDRAGVRLCTFARINTPLCFILSKAGYSEAKQSLPLPLESRRATRDDEEGDGLFLMNGGMVRSKLSSKVYDHANFCIADNGQSAWALDDAGLLTEWSSLDKERRVREGRACAGPGFIFCDNVRKRIIVLQRTESLQQLFSIEIESAHNRE